MPNFAFPPAAVRAEIARPLPLQIVTSCPEPPEGDGWLHEVKHDGHRLIAIIAAGELQLISRNGHDRTQLFRTPFDKLAAAGLPPLVLDGEIAVPDERGVTHIDGLTEALRLRKPERLAYFAFDLLHLDGHDLRPCATLDRKALLHDVIGAAECERLVFVDHIDGNGAALFEPLRHHPGTPRAGRCGASFRTLPHRLDQGRRAAQGRLNHARRGGAIKSKLVRPSNNGQSAQPVERVALVVYSGMQPLSDAATIIPAMTKTAERERWSGKKPADMSPEESARAAAAGYEPGPDGYYVGRDPRRMTHAELEAMGHQRMSPISAIRTKCLDCCAGSPNEVRLCVAIACPSWPFRMGSSPWRPKPSEERLAAMRRSAGKMNAARSKHDKTRASDAGTGGPVGK